MSIYGSGMVWGEEAHSTGNPTADEIALASGSLHAMNE